MAQQVILIGTLQVVDSPVTTPPQPPGHPALPIWGPPGSNFPDKPGYPPVAGHPLPEPPPGIWGPPGPWPTPPIYLPPQGPGGAPGHPAFPIWGPPGSNFPDKPGYPPVAGHPLPPVPPLGIWGPPGPWPTPPIYLPPMPPPGTPTHPIVLPDPPPEGPDETPPTGGFIAYWSPRFGWISIPWGDMRPTQPTPSKG